MVDTHDRRFVWQTTFADTLHSFRNATLAWAQGIRIFTTNRRHSHSKKKQVAEATLKMFPKLVTFTDHGYSFTLTPAFQQAIARAEAAAADPQIRR